MHRWCLRIDSGSAGLTIRGIVYLNTAKCGAACNRVGNSAWASSWRAASTSGRRGRARHRRAPPAPQSLAKERPWHTCRARVRSGQADGKAAARDPLGAGGQRRHRRPTQHCWMIARRDPLASALAGQQGRLRGEGGSEEHSAEGTTRAGALVSPGRTGAAARAALLPAHRERFSRASGAPGAQSNPQPSSRVGSPSSAYTGPSGCGPPAAGTSRWLLGAAQPRVHASRVPSVTRRTPSREAAAGSRRASQ